MRNVIPILIVAFIAAVSIVAFIAQHEVAWLIMGLCYMLGGVGLAAAWRERGRERREVGQAERRAILHALRSVRPPEHLYQPPEDRSDD